MLESPKRSGAHRLSHGAQAHARPPARAPPRAGCPAVAHAQGCGVRGLEHRDAPGDITHLHHHPAFVLYALAPFKRKITLSDGTMIVRTFKAGDVLYSPAQTHIGKNIGTTPPPVIVVEMKAGPAP